jgi:hypothetical protein
MKSPLFYPVLAGTDPDRPKWPALSGRTDAEISTLEQLVAALNDHGTAPSLLQPDHIPLYGLAATPDEPTEISLWGDPADFCIDRLIALQATPGMGQDLFRSNLRGRRNTAPFLIDIMPSQAQCAAFLAYYCLRYLARNLDQLPSTAPIRTDPAGRESITTDLEAWVAPFLEIGHLTFEEDPLYQTPKSTSLTHRDGVHRSLLIDEVAARIAHCLVRNRPIIVTHAVAAPPKVIAEMIALARHQDDSTCPTIYPN